MRSFKSHRPKLPAKIAAGAAPRTPRRPVVTARPGPAAGKAAQPAKGEEIGGPEGPEPTRYGDWERKGICYDF